MPRANLGGVELRVMERGNPVVAVIVAPIQAIELADKLVRAAFAAIDPDGVDR